MLHGSISTGIASDSWPYVRNERWRAVRRDPCIMLMYTALALAPGALSIYCIFVGPCFVLW